VARLEDRVRTVCLVLLTSIAVGVALYWLRPVMIPFVLAVFVSLILSSIIDFQRRRLRMPYVVAAISTGLLAWFAFTLVMLVISASVGQLTANASSYNQQFATLLARSLALLPEGLRDHLPETNAVDLTKMTVRSVGGMLLGTTNAVLGILSQSILVMIFVIFLMMGGRSSRLPSGLWGEAESRVKRYLVTKAVISAATGTLVGLTLTLLGVPLAMAFGLLAFLLNFVPSVGSIIATLLPLPVVMVSPDITSTVATLAIVIPGAIQLVIGNIIDPRIMGESLDIHPVVIVISLLLWGMLWGIPGALMAVPITAVVKILLEKFDETRVIAEVMAGRLDRWRSPEPA
jgi:AI-2 transport protein TqsA